MTIDGYWWLFYWWLLNYFLGVIGGYSIGGYWWLLAVILLVAIDGYSRLNYYR
jgi:hypothetical protein